MSESSSSIFGVRRTLRRVFRPSSSIPDPETFHPPSPPPPDKTSSPDNKCDVVFLLHSDLLSVASIATHLSSHLKKLGVSVAFSGDKEESILSASVCIVFLSKDFADSTVRLKELWMIHECKKMDIIPIFLGVRPSETRTVDVKKGVFEDAFANASKVKDYKEGWKKAFERTALLSGWKFSDFRGDTKKLLKAVVQSVMKKVDSSSLQVAKHPVGLDEKTSKLERLLEAAGTNTKRARVLGIVGMGGIGKTTLAKHFFNTTRNDFKAACFIEDVKGRVENTGIERVQSLLLKDLLQVDHHIHSANQGKYLLKKCLLRSEVIIVLDNIDDPDHLDALWVPEYIHHKSIILITTRDRKLLECVSNSLIYDMEGLETKFARELFCWHAFLKTPPPLGFNILVEGFVKYCNGLPLSLETLGGKLYGEEGPAWEETLKNIAESLPGDIEKQLRVSYDALDLSEKQIFLDIALFFIGEDKEMAVRIWNILRWYGSVGVQSLQQKCLVKLVNGRFQMHDQLRQMAAKIVDDENTENPGYRSRLWRSNDVMKVLTHESGSENVQAITLVAKQIQDERLHSSIVPKSVIVRNQYGGLSSSWSIKAFVPMTELRLLILEDACVEGDFRLLSKKILWLRWRHCPSGSLPVGLPVQNLLILDLSGGRMSSLWSDTDQIPVHLKELLLRGCMSLQRFPKSIKFLIGLEKLILSHCLGIVDLPDEFCDIYSLKHVDLSGCLGLHSLPDRIGNWKQLQFLDLSKCKKLEYLPSSFGDLKKLEHLDLQCCSAFSKLPPSFHKLVELRYLNVDMCMKLESGNDLTVGFSKLEFLNTTMCKRFILPHVITFQHCIRIMKVSCSQFKVLPDYLGHLENLEELHLWKGCEVEALDPFVFTKLSKLKDLTIGQFPLLEGLGTSLGNLRQLKSLSIALCGLSHLPEEIGSLQALERLIIINCSKLAKLPASIKKLSSLTDLCLIGCSRLQLDPEAFPNISSLQKLHLGSCKVADNFFQFVCEGGSALKELELKNMSLPKMNYIGAIPSNSAALSILSCTNISYFEIFRGISSLKIEGCPGLKKITVPVHNTSLQILNLSNCENLVEICFIENLKNLKILNINGCLDLRTVDGLEKLRRLSEFHMFLSDGYLLYSNNWLEKTLNTIKIPHATHLSATVDLRKHLFKPPPCFEEIPRYSSTEFRFSPRVSFCGVVICFIARHSLFENMGTSGVKDSFYQSISLRLVNGAAFDTEICRYKITDPSTFCHVSIVMDEFLVSEMSAPGSELVISSGTEDLVSRAWIFLIPGNEKHLVGEVACNLIENLMTHKKPAEKDFVERIDLAKIKLENEFENMIIDMDLCGIHALGITNFIIQRTYTFDDVAIYVETIKESYWEKHRQVLFWDLNRLEHLDLELGCRCRNLVEKPVFNHFEARVFVGNVKRATSYVFTELRFPPEGALENYYSLKQITSSHKTAPWRTYT